MNVYITNLASFLPGDPVANDDIERYLGPVDRISNRTKSKILSSNGIQSRYYAIDKNSGAPTHTNAQLTADAIRKLELPPAAESPCLACGTSSPDQLMPGHASMVHGELGEFPCEVVSTAGICLSGIMAMKYGAMAVALGSASFALTTGSELASSYMRTDFFNQVCSQQASQEESSHPAFSFEEQFLRWMLSDGAGAALIEREPRGACNLRIDWIELTSQAHRLETCMYAGCSKKSNGQTVGWRESWRRGHQSGGILTIKQDAKLLNREVLSALVGKALPPIIAKHGLTPDQIDWFLPHYSSAFFREPLAHQLEAIDFALPQERWFTNLASKGNTGSASFYIMLEELLHSGRLRPGERILGFIPESGRFAAGYILLTVV